MKNKRILIINCWGGNRGDEAQINSLYRLIKNIDKSYDVHFLPFRYENIELDPGIKNGSTVIKRTAKYYYSIFSRVLHKMTMEGKKYGFILLLKNRFESLIKIFSFLDLLFLKNYQLIISAPQGPTISDISYKEKKIYTLYPLYYAQKFAVPYCIIGVSMGPFEKKSYKEKWVGNVLRNAKRIILREDISYKNTIEKYPDLINLMSAIDIVFSIDSKINKEDKNFKSYIAYKNTLNKDWIGACISLTPSRTFLNEFNISEYMKKITCFFDFVIEYTGKRLLLMPHLKKDYPYLKDIQNNSKLSDKIQIFPIIYNSDYQQDIIKYLDFFISSRYHPTIFAIKAQIPFFCIINQFKTMGMLKKINLLKKDIWQDDDIKIWKEYFIKSWENRDNLKNDIVFACQKGKNIAKLYNQALSDLLV